MELFGTSVLLAITFFLTVLHLLIHGSRGGRLNDKIPGPRQLPVIGNSLNLLVSFETLWNRFREYANGYYPTYKFWICHWPVVSIRHPDDVEIMLSSQKHIKKSLFYDFLHPWLNSGLLTSTGKKWRMRRKVLTPAFHFNMLQEFMDIFVETSEHMVNSLKKEGDEFVKDLVPLLAKHTLSVICETAMGTTLQDKDPLQEEYRKGVKQIGESVIYRAVRPWLKNDWIFSMTKEGREQTKSLKALHNFTNKIIKERKEYHETTGGNNLKLFSMGKMIDDTNVSDIDISIKTKRLAMLDLLIAVQKEHNNIDDLGIREEVDTFIFEGHDTTAASMCFAVLLLAEHKEIQARARAEIDAAFKESNGRLGLNELQNLSYLDRCVKESLRLYPAVPVISRNLTEDLQLTNYLIPPGTVLAVHIYDVHRDPNFWPDPEVYDPDRFLPERIKNRHPFSYIPFSAGPRNCIGQKFAMLELKTTLAYMLHNFYLEPIIDLTKVRMLPDLVLKSVNPLDVKFIPIQR